MALLNGLIGETDSLLKGVLATIDENFDEKKAEETADILLNMLGFLVIVPSNPETTFFILVEGILSILKNHEWGKQGHLLKAKIHIAIINYLST